MTDIFISARRGAGAPAEILYGTVTWKPTLTHSRGTSVVLPTPTTYDLVDGQVVATNVQPTPEPVEGQIEWAYEVTFKDRHSKTYSFLVGVPDSTSQVNFTSLPRYFETKPPLFGQGPQGVPGEAATVDVGTVAEGGSASVTNSGTNTDAVLDFVLPQGPQGPKGDGVNYISATTADALPTVYPDGISYFSISSNTGTGWPLSFASVWTYKAQSTARTTQMIISHNGEGTWQRIGTTGSGWGAFERLATNALATTSANGLMSSADKVRLDDFGSLPFKSKSVGDAARTYPVGLSTTVVSSEQGWPETSEYSVFSVVTTSKPKSNEVALQWISPYISASTGPSLDAPKLFYRVGSVGDSWSEFREVAVDDGTLARKGAGFVLASDYATAGTVMGDGTNNDYWPIQRAINAANGRDVLIEGGKTYFIGGTLSMPANARNISIRGVGAEPPILKIGASGQSYSAIKFEQTVPAVTTTLVTRIGANQHGWEVASTAGITPGMLCEVVSSVLWYFDPRPGEGEARKSELHKVRKVEGSKVYFEDPSFDGYAVVGETVELKFFNPIKVKLENLVVLGTLPVPAEETNAVIGIEIQHADNPQVINVSTDSCARTGVYFNRCYRPYLQGGTSKRSNNFWNGYGVSVSGSTHGIIKDRVGYECRRNVDVTGANVVSRMTTIENCTAVGGGYNSRGIEYGWSEDTGALRADQYGFGSHGPADQTRYINNTTLGIMRPYSLRGRDEVLVNLRHVGRTHGGVIQLGFGTNLFVQGGVVTSGTWSHKNGVTYYTGGTPNAAGVRPDNFVRMYPNYQTNPPSGTQWGRVIIKGVSAELQDSFMWIYPQTPVELPLGHLVLSDLSVQFWNPNASGDCYLIRGEGITQGTGSKSRWFIGPNQLILDAGSGTIRTATANISLAGANVLNYTVQA